MNRTSLICLLGLTLVGCESLYDDGGIPRIRSQRQVDAYNATVSVEDDKLVCTRERTTTSNIPEFVCMTVGQRKRQAADAQLAIDEIR